MFDIGFSEIIVCAVVALVVIGPERMPEAVRTVGLWIGRIKRSLRETRSEIERQIGVDDIRRQLHNEEIMRSLQDARRDMDDVIAETQKAIDSTVQVVTREYKSEPDLPYHSHTEEQLTHQVQPSISDTEQVNLQQHVVDENTRLAVTTKAETSSAATKIADNPAAHPSNR